MLTPTVAHRFGWFYAVGNTPATNLARSGPHGEDADILTLGCGDLRNILYTAYVERGLAQRQLDITCCDIDEKMIGRNIFFLTLVLDQGETVTDESLWDIYYHLFLDDATSELVLQQTQKLAPFLDSLEAWKNGPYSTTLRLCDKDTLDDVRRVCQRVLDAARSRGEAGHRKFYSKCLKTTKDLRDRSTGGGGHMITGLRSAAPLSLTATDSISRASIQYATDGTVTSKPDGVDLPNPMFAGLLSDTEILHYGTDPVLGYHLATAYAPLTKNSPLKPDVVDPSFKAAAAAKTQFREWVAALRLLFDKGQVVLRFVVADVYAFCHTLQHVAASGQPSASWYRRQFDLKRLCLDDKVYGSGGDGPTAFDVIDTSNLSDHVGALNMLVATVPLLKETPGATVYTELMLKRPESQKKVFDGLLCGHPPTVSLLLGVSPVQYWTNAKCESHVDEIFLSLVAESSPESGKETQLHSRLAWKRDDQFSSQVHGRGPLHVEAKTLARLLFQLYLEMFNEEGYATIMSSASSRSATYPSFHRGSFAALLKMVMHRVKTDWPVVCSTLLDNIAQDRSLSLSSNMMQELGVQMYLQGVNTEAWLLNDVRTLPSTGPLSGWRDIPPAVAVTLVVPRPAFEKLFNVAEEDKMASPTLVASLRPDPSSANQWHNLYSDVQITFGNVKAQQSGEDSPVVVEQDERGWAGSSTVIASFMVPTAALQVEPTTAIIALTVLTSVQAARLYRSVLGPTMTVFETTLGDSTRVFVSKFMPNQTSHRVTGAGIKPLALATEQEPKGHKLKVLTEIPASESHISTVTGHVDITSAKGKRLLRDKVPIELLQDDPFVIRAVFGESDLVCPLRFPVPVTKEGCKSRVARTSGYLEVIAPVADAVSGDVLTDFMFPTQLSLARLPVALNAPHINLDNLPILDVEQKDDMRWLTTLASLQFSAGERRLRESASAKDGIAENPRVNFKESLFTMFMLASGLQGGQTGMFAINHPERGGIHMLIFVSAMRLDGDTASVVLDAAVIPFTTELVASRKMDSFLLLIRTLECCTITVNDAELVLWKKILPSLAERCRTWAHLPKCEYRRTGAAIPLSVEPAQQALCSCGNGKLPNRFISLPEWETAAPNAVRIAISPTYAVPFVVNVVDAAAMAAASSQEPTRERCRRCGSAEGKDGAALKKCMRCHEAKYCSAECQKKDWKKHRMECKETDS
ncbi:MYND finger family protein [Purpureocillium lavendulum]|uniref:MYND finger family protein n=1 Tax=Purpureocillium lavendulum TaxID=1247861 RepID=A0AB34FQ41_9HYPO|nr:MYND finger family protein [Purpureocillium lavendulum]